MKSKGNEQNRPSAEGHFLRCEVDQSDGPPSSTKQGTRQSLSTSLTVSSEQAEKRTLTDFHVSFSAGGCLVMI